MNQQHVISITSQIMYYTVFNKIQFETLFFLKMADSS